MSTILQAVIRLEPDQAKILSEYADIRKRHNFADAKIEHLYDRVASLEQSQFFPGNRGTASGNVLEF